MAYPDEKMPNLEKLALHLTRVTRWEVGGLLRDMDERLKCVQQRDPVLSERLEIDKLRGQVQHIMRRVEASSEPGRDGTQDQTSERLFDQATALRKVGQRIRTQMAFSGVPQGTFGQVIQADAKDGGYTLAIQWELPERAKPLVDWFSRAEYERFLREL